MAFFISVVSSPGAGAPPGTRVAVGPTGCTLGRNLDNDLALPDQERVISGHHARLDMRDGALWLTDQSTNGTFLNHDSERLPPQQPVRIAAGDRIGIGPYELTVTSDGAGSQTGASPFADPAGGGLPGLTPTATGSDILDLLGTPSGDPELLGVGPLDQQPRAPECDPLGFKPDLLPDDALALDDLLTGPATPAPAAPPATAPTPFEHVHVAPPVLGAPHAPAAAAPMTPASPDQPPTPMPPDYDLLADAFDTPDSAAAGGEPPWVDPFGSEPLGRMATTPTAPQPDLPAADGLDWTDSAVPAADPPAPAATEATDQGSADLGLDLDWSHWGEPAPTDPATANTGAGADAGADAGTGAGTGAGPMPSPAVAPPDLAPIPAPAAPPPITASTPSPEPSVPVAGATVSASTGHGTGAATGAATGPATTAGTGSDQALSDQALLQAFLTGLGSDPATPVADPAALLQAGGALLRELTAGLTTTLQARAVFKNELRLGMTVMRARENNAFKFSATVEEAIERLLLHPRPGYLPALQAARESHEDIQAHEMAMLAGLQAALRSLLARFEPSALEQRLGARSGLDKLLPMARRSRYWELFTETYTQVAADATEDFMDLFGDAFTRAYEDQIQRLKLARRQAPDGIPNPARTSRR